MRRSDIPHVCNSMRPDSGRVDDRAPGHEPSDVVVDRRVIWNGCPVPGGAACPKAPARRIASARAASALVHAVATLAHTSESNDADRREVITTQEGCPKCGGLLRATVVAGVRDPRLRTRFGMRLQATAP